MQATLQFERGTVQVEFPIGAIGPPVTGGDTMMQGGGMTQMKPRQALHISGGAVAPGRRAGRGA